MCHVLRNHTLTRFKLNFTIENQLFRHKFQTISNHKRGWPTRLFFGNTYVLQHIKVVVLYCLFVILTNIFFHYIYNNKNGHVNISRHTMTSNI